MPPRRRTLVLNINKIYAESVRGVDQLQRIVDEAQAMVDEALGMKRVQ